MAQIDLEKKKSGGLGWLWALLAAAAVIGIVLFFVFNGEGDDDELGAGVEVAAVDPDDSSDDFEEESDTNEENEAVAADRAEQNEGQFPLAQIMANPGEWNGKTVNGDVTVGAVPTDRGFWVEEDGSRAFFIVDPEGEESDAHIQQGQRLRIKGATVRQELSSVGPVEEQARTIIAEQSAFFVVDPNDFEIL